MVNNTRTEITMKFSVNLDLVPGWGDCPEDWIKLITSQFLSPEHYKPTVEIIDVSYTERK